MLVSYVAIGCAARFAQKQNDAKKEAKKIALISETNGQFRLFCFEAKQRFLHAKRNIYKTKIAKRKKLNKKSQYWIEEEVPSVAEVVLLVHTVA